MGGLFRAPGRTQSRRFRSVLSFAALLCGMACPAAAAGAPDAPLAVTSLLSRIEPGIATMERKGWTEKPSDPAASLNRIPPPGAAFLPETEITVAAVGDVIPHYAVQSQARDHPLGFRSLWKAAEPIFAEADIVYANLETPVARGLSPAGAVGETDGGPWDLSRVYTGYPMFNAPPSLAADLKASGVTIVSTSNNHALDRGPLGVDLTKDALDRVGLTHVGTRRRNETGEDGWVTIVRARGMRIAWLGCTYSTNGFADIYRQMLKCYDDQGLIMSMIARLSDRDDVDAVIVTPHFGEEYSEVPTERQKQFARNAVRAGALAVLGSHPHVVQPSEWHHGREARFGFIQYSLGNFISNQDALATRSSIILLLNLARSVNGTVVITAVRYVPVFMDRAPTGQGNHLTLRAASPTGDGGLHWQHVVDRMGPTMLHTRALADPSEFGAALSWRPVGGPEELVKGYEGVADDTVGLPGEQFQASLESAVLMWNDTAEKAEGAIPGETPVPPAEGAAGDVIVSLEDRAEDLVASPTPPLPEGVLNGQLRIGR